MSQKNPVDTKRPLYSIFRYAALHNKKLTIGLVLAILISVTVSVTPPLILRRIVDELTAENATLPFLIQAGLLYFALTAVSGIADSVKETIITIFGQRSTRHIRSFMADKLSRLPSSVFIENDSGSLASLFVNDVDTLEDLFDSGIISMISDVFRIVSILCVVYFLSKGLMILLFLSLPILFLLTRTFQRRMLSAQLDNRKAVAGINQAIPETIASIRTIRLYHRESFMEERYGKSVRAGFDAMNRSNLYDSIYSPIIITVSSLIIAIMVVLSVSRSDFQALFGMSAGTAVALIAYVGKVFSPLESIGMEIQNIQSAIAGCKRISDFLSEKEMEPPSAAVSEKEENIPISIRHLSFAYEDGKPVFHNFDLTIHEGENVTLIGRTGSGKSTLFKLICGLYQPSEGTVRIFGRAPESIPEEERRKVFGLVEQQFKPVSGNMRDQITLSDPSISEEDVRRALAETGILPAIEDLPEGLDTPYDPGLLSQGQFQLLSIARATVTNPPLLLLDEITANLDSVTEKQVLNALRAASEKRTVLSISHRLFEAAGGRQVRIGH